jgi:hypothetical protein
MRRLFAFLAVLLLASGLVFGSAAHAYEAAACVEPCSAFSELAISDPEPAPETSGKCAPGRCCCHGHHVGVAATPSPVGQTAEARIVPVAGKVEQRPRGITDTSLRPPRA